MELKRKFCAMLKKFDYLGLLIKTKNIIKIMKKQLDKVRAFQYAFNQTVNENPTLLPITESELRFSLGREELEEYEQAYDDRDLVDVLDSLVDQAYVLFGTINAHGLQDLFLEAFDLVHYNNMSKLDENGEVLKNEFGKVIKPANFKPVDLKQLF